MPDPEKEALTGRAVLRISRMLELVSRRGRARIEGRRDRTRGPTEVTASRRSSEEQHEHENPTIGNTQGSPS
jgi:hypothetical protein